MKSFLSKLIVLLIALFLVLGTYSVLENSFSLGTSGSNGPVACTLDARICPDGSAVGRTGPNCEFALCPDDNSDVDVWLTSFSSDQKFAFQYPKTITTEFVKVVEWPPQIQVLNSSFSCTGSGTESETTINGRAYCATKVSEGAAGSTYTTYTYAFPFEQKTAVFTFSVRFPQCANYDEPNSTGCRLEQAEFKPINQVDRMAQTIMSL